MRYTDDEETRNIPLPDPEECTPVRPLPPVEPAGKIERDQIAYQDMVDKKQDTEIRDLHSNLVTLRNDLNNVNTTLSTECTQISASLASSVQQLQRNIDLAITVIESEISAQVNTNSVSANTGTFGEANITEVNATDVITESVEAELVASDEVKATKVEAETADIDEEDVTTSRIQYLTAINATITNLNLTNADLETLDSANATITNLIAILATFGTVKTDNYFGKDSGYVNPAEFYPNPDELFVFTVPKYEGVQIVHTLDKSISIVVANAMATYTQNPDIILHRVEFKPNGDAVFYLTKAISYKVMRIGSATYTEPTYSVIPKATKDRNIDALNGVTITAEVSERLDEEIEDRIAADEYLQNQILDNDRDITTLTNNLAAEAGTRAEADTALGNTISAISTGLATETQNRTAADTTLQNNITNVANDLNTEATARAEADTALSNNLSTEANTRSEADIALRNDLNTEIETRGTADTALSNRIDAEAQTREETDTGLRTDLTTETTERKAKDESLDADIASLEERKQDNLTFNAPLNNTDCTVTLDTTGEWAGNAGSANKVNHTLTLEKDWTFNGEEDTKVWSELVQTDDLVDNDHVGLPEAGIEYYRTYGNHTFALTTEGEVWMTKNENGLTWKKVYDRTIAPPKCEGLIIAGGYMFFVNTYYAVGINAETGDIESYTSADDHVFTSAIAGGSNIYMLTDHEGHQLLRLGVDRVSHTIGYSTIELPTGVTEFGFTVGVVDNNVYINGYKSADNETSLYYRLDTNESTPWYNTATAQNKVNRQFSKIGNYLYMFHGSMDVSVYDDEQNKFTDISMPDHTEKYDMFSEGGKIWAFTDTGAFVSEDGISFAVTDKFPKTITSHSRYKILDGREYFWDNTEAFVWKDNKWVKEEFNLSDNILYDDYTGLTVVNGKVLLADISLDYRKHNGVTDELQQDRRIANVPAFPHSLTINGQTFDGSYNINMEIKSGTDFDWETENINFNWV